MITLHTLIRRSLRFHWRSHLGVLLGAMIGGAALTGALIVGDSVRGSLREMALARLGKIGLALEANDRLFRDSLAREIRPHAKTSCAAVLVLPGMAASQNQNARANRVQVLGIGTDFAEMHNSPAAPKEIPRDSVALNRALADQLGISAPGETVILRFKKPSALAREATISTKSDAEVAWRVKVHAILGEDELGRFSLRANQSAAYNAFVNLSQLQELTQQTNRANLLLVSQWLGIRGFYKGDLAAIANQQLAQHWQLADAQAELRELSGRNTIELISSRVFLDEPLAQAALASAGGAQPVLTYLVNLLRAGTNITPYSMVAALPAPLLPADLRDNEILISQWLADDLRIGPGAEISLAYFQADSGVQLAEHTNFFKVRAVVPMDSPLADRTLMPEFPGIAKAESTRDWDAGFPLVHKIRDPDDQYWKQYRGTPKAFVTLAAGQKMWGNRYGNLTALRFPVPVGQAAPEFRAELEKRILSQLAPGQLGLRFENVRQQALAAADQSQDFGGLFIGFSFFLILAALILTALLFRFGIEQRLAEAGVLLAMGFTPGRVRRLFLSEGVALAVLGSAVGVVGGLFYAQAMLHGLTTSWQSATGITALSFHLTVPSLAIGFVAGVLAAIFSLWLVLRQIGRQPATELLSSQWGTPMPEGSEPVLAPRLAKWPWMSLGGLIVAAGMVGGALAAGQAANPGLFFGAGALLLGSLIGLCRWWIGRAAQGGDDGTRLTLGRLSWRGCARRRGRSLATVTLLACGSFIIAAIGVFQLDANRDAARRASGTGGFALWGESTLPVLRDLNTAEGRDFYGLDEKDLAGVSVVAMRVREGDEASCLNLNRAQRPRLLGVKPALLQERGAFTFAGVMKGADRSQGWRLLERSFNKLPPGEIAAIGDAASIQWALGSKIGGALDYTDDQGRAFKLRLVAGVANSILQGNLLIDEAEFTRLFPGESGHRILLLDAPSNRVTEVSATLTRALQNMGLELTPTVRRLAQFNAVQNTYLNTFRVLGGLGLLLGSAGLGVVVLRNLLERRAELALLLAVGFSRDALPRLAAREHGLLLALGLGIGVAAALVAVSPALLTPGNEIPYGSLGATLGGVLALGLASTWLAARAALRGRLPDALRNE